MSLAARWKRLSHFWRHVVINLLLGLVIDALIHAFHHAPVVQRAENRGIDLAIRFFGDRGGAGDPEPGLAYTILDIDDPTWQLWGSPNVTPRDRLLAMLRTATGGSAAAVLVDLDLTSREADNGRTAGPADLALGEFLESYRGTVPIVLPRLLRASVNPDSSESLPSPVPAWFEPVRPGGPVHWGTVQFVEEDDGVVRRWRLFEPVCEESGPRVLPSVQLILAATVDTATSPAMLAEALREMAPPSCGDAEEIEGAGLFLFGHVIKPRSAAIPERIIYSIAWPPEPHAGRMVRLPDGTVVPTLLRLSASQATDSQTPLDPRLLDHRVVVIGTSAGASRDWYTTPLGRMPGMAVVVNAVESLRRYGQYGTHSTVLYWAVFVALLIGSSLAYARFDPFVATLIVLPLIYVAVLPISFYLFDTGVWLDFTAPVLGVQLHELIANAETAWAQRGRRFAAHE